MRKLRSLASLAVTLALASAVPVSAPAAAQQVTFQFGCRAVNGYGVWADGFGTTPAIACQYAVKNCSLVAPVGTVCVWNNWWQNW